MHSVISPDGAHVMQIDNRLFELVFLFLLGGCGVRHLLDYGVHLPRHIPPRRLRRNGHF